MTQNNNSKKDAGDKDKELKVNNNWEITFYNDDSYMISNKDVYIHSDEIAFKTKNTKNAWLSIYNEGSYVASIWINTPYYIRKIKKFIKEMMVIE